MFVISFIPLGYIRKTIRKITEVNVFSILSFFRDERQIVAPSKFSRYYER